MKEIYYTSGHGTLIRALLKRLDLSKYNMIDLLRKEDYRCIGIYNKLMSIIIKFPDFIKWVDKNFAEIVDVVCKFPAHILGSFLVNYRCMETPYKNYIRCIEHLIYRTDKNSGNNLIVILEQMNFSFDIIEEEISFKGN